MLFTLAVLIHHSQPHDLSNRCMHAGTFHAPPPCKKTKEKLQKHTAIYAGSRAQKHCKYVTEKCLSKCHANYLNLITSLREYFLRQ